jgi:hypothetical protein
MSNFYNQSYGTGEMLEDLYGNRAYMNQAIEG